MVIHISVPSKTFLFGEYAVLNGDAGIVLNTEPKFGLIATEHKNRHCQLEGIHPNSPAGKWVHSTDVYNQYHIQFLDPYHGLGGLGASSAQFAMISALNDSIIGKQTDDGDLLNRYLQFAWDGQGIPPSGVDLIAQRHGYVCYCNKNKKTLETMSWPFETLAYCLIHTGNKLATHDHLKQLKLFNYHELNNITEMGLTSLKNCNSELFIHAIQQQAAYLKKENLVLEQTILMLNQLATHPDILAAKGCGAMGADIILIIYHPQNQKNIISWIKNNHFNIVKYGNNVANGIEITVS
jgi:mevalonate kinase